ncbi:RteC domain-containing protein [Sphingobacterium hungaricum]|uniref:Tetracycline regulation of excision, RteC n=1 Tax=Sphingobacterium hungaricum TaxID=2082723 RepID=A0A928YRT7_9SPHI|nr:RteC domain-containing protein [Sphingobacterium hungaricum]MBE8715304.1 tetracycline regulation of excision, RteC [Sphingobacterium hungaricum]
MEYAWRTIISEVEARKVKIFAKDKKLVGEVYEMMLYLQEILRSLKKSIATNGFDSEREEIYFFREVKPQILGKLIYYNNVYCLEIACPNQKGKIYKRFFSLQLRKLKKEYEEISKLEFFKYYRSGRSDNDQTYFRMGNINYFDGLCSIVFEIDINFSTYYDGIISRIIANDLLYVYLHAKINPSDNDDFNLGDVQAEKDFSWTESKNALIELIYALQASGAISYGKLEIRKMVLVFQKLFKIQMTDPHHAFHRMKQRAGSRTIFLDQLKGSLEEYMNKGL